MTTAGRERGEISENPPPPVAVASTVTVETIDRTKRCPLLLRMFARTGGHNRVTEYRQNQFPDNELSIHTWMDADLRELAELVKQTQSSARGKDAVMEFSLVYPDKRGINVMKVLGTVHSSQEGEDDTKTLKQLKFQTGDFMDVAILVPNRLDRGGPPGRERDRGARDGRPFGRPGPDRGGDRGGDRGMGRPDRDRDRGPPQKRY